MKAEESCSTAGHVRISVMAHSLAFHFGSNDLANTRQKKLWSGDISLKQNKQRVQCQMLWTVKCS